MAINTLKIDTSTPVLVTGATGYVAGWVVKDLLEAGVTVHAAVRDPNKTEKLQHLVDLADASTGRIEFFASDLLKPGSYAAAMKGCAVVFHTASPFTVDVEDPQKELIDPAKLGTRNVLEEASRTPSVKRVVLTSSCAAIYTDAIDTINAPGGRLTEDVWNETASLDYQPYSYSKALAEKEAWMIAGKQSQWDLVAVNPCMVMGPAIHTRPTSESFNMVRQIGDGTLKMGAPRFGTGVVDVRDLARAHMAAAYVPAANGRHIIAGHETNMLEMAQVLQDRYGKDYPIPRRALPKWLIWLVGPMNGFPRRMVAGNVNVPWRADNTKSKRELGITYRPLKESMEDMFQQMIDAGQFDAT